MKSSDDSDVPEDDERTVIKSEISSLSFEALQKLKERIGAKVYKEVIFGDKNNARNGPKVFKRENKNRPREMSSKRPVPILNDIAPVKKNDVRDPRFDPLCGTFDKKEFSNNFGFLSDIRVNDIKATRTELKQTTDPEREKELRRLLQRLNDQQKANKKSQTQKKTIHTKKEQVEAELQEGKQTYFKNKSELRVESLVKQYEELKKQGTGRIQRHLKRRQQKIKKKSFKTRVGAS